MATATAETSRSAAKPATGPHGAEELPSVVVTSYNLEIRDEDGFVGDKASRSAFVEHLDALRAHLKRNGDDPLDGETARISKKELDAHRQALASACVRPALAGRQLGDFFRSQPPAFLDALRAMREAELDLRLVRREIGNHRPAGEVADGKRKKPIDCGLSHVSCRVANHE